MSMIDQLPGHVRSTMHPEVRGLIEHLEERVAQAEGSAATNASIIRGRAQMLANEMIEALHQLADVSTSPQQPSESRQAAQQACRLLIQGFDRVRAAGAGLELADEMPERPITLQT